MAQARFTLAGRVTPVAQAEISAARATFLAKNPHSFWVGTESLVLSIVLMPYEVCSSM